MKVTTYGVRPKTHNQDQTRDNLNMHLSLLSWTNIPVFLHNINEIAKKGGACMERAVQSGSLKVALHLIK